MEKRYIVQLTGEERMRLNKLVSNGNTSTKNHRIATILLLADSSQGQENGTTVSIAEKVGVSSKTITRLCQKFVEGGLDKVFEKKFTPRYSRRKFDGEQEAKLVALCCSEPPEGHARWTLRLLADKVVALEITDSVCHETIRETLKKMNLSRGKKKSGAFHQKRTQNLFAEWRTF